MIRFPKLFRQSKKQYFSALTQFSPVRSMPSGRNFHGRNDRKLLIIQRIQIIQVELKINWNHKRCKHAIERMWLRGVSMDEVKDAIIKGKKSKQTNTGLIEAFYRFFSVVYDEQVLKNKELRKIDPVTVKLW